MDINNIKQEYQNLSQELKSALSRMERSDRVFIIRDQMKELQNLCPHSNGSYDFSNVDECPYCGKKFKQPKNDDWICGVKVY